MSMKRRICYLFAVLLFSLVPLIGCAEKQEAVSSALPQSSSSAAETSTAAVSSALEASSGPESVFTSEMTEREKGWREDFAYFKECYAQNHADPFYFVSEEELDWQLEQLAKKVPELSDTDLFFELSKIVAGLGDNHTALLTPEGFYSQIFPVGVCYIGEKLCPYAYLEGYEQFEPYLLHEIVSVNGVDIKYLEKKMESFINPNNVWARKTDFVNHFFMPAFFEWAGCDTKNGYSLQLLDDDQRVVSVEMPVIDYDEKERKKVVKAENWDAVDFRNKETGVEFHETEQGSYVLFTLSNSMYNQEELYDQLMKKAASLLAEHPGSKLVIDLRNDPGGWQEAVDDIEERIPLLKESYEPQTYVVTSGHTASGAIGVLLNFKREMNAVQIGEPTGQFTFFWGLANAPELTLPFSGIEFQIGNQRGYYPSKTIELRFDENSKLYECENTVLPDVYVSQSIEDAKQGKDSVIEWILEH